MAVVSRPITGLRSAPSCQAELLTQEILGRTVSVVTVAGDWTECVLADGYRGWTPSSALHNRHAYAATHIVADRFARIHLDEGSDLLVPMGSLLAVETSRDDRSRIELPDERSGWVRQSRLRPLGTLPLDLEAFGSIQKEMEGTPYLWGGKSTFGFDCSGLTQAVFEFFGVELPRDSKDQAATGRPVEEVGDLRRFDLLFFGNQDTIDHVAIHLGDLSILHASGYVRVESLEESSPLCRRDLLGRFRFARRITGV